MNQAHTLTLDDVKFDVSTGTIEKYTSDYKNIVIPDHFDGTPVTSIGSSAFITEFYNVLMDNTYGLTSVTIPNSVTYIGNYAFQFNLLTSVIIPESVTYIGSNAFANNALTSVIIPDAVTSIEDAAFECNELTTVTIPESVTIIGCRAFKGNLLKSVTIPDSVLEIRDGAFQGNLLTSVTIPDSVVELGASAFEFNLLTNATIPDSVTKIGDYAFYRNKLSSDSPVIDNSSEKQPHILTRDDVEFNHSTGTIVKYMANYKYIVIPDVLDGTPVKAIGAEAFVKYTYDSEHDKYYDHTGEERGFYECDGCCVCLRTYDEYCEESHENHTECDGFEDREGWPFVEDEQLRKVTIPNSVTSIGDYAFANNALTEADVIIPDTVTIGDSVFCEFNVYG